MPQITAYLSSLNALPGSSVALHVDASDDAGKLTLSCFHSMETSNCLLSLPITSPASQIPIPEDWEAGMYKLIVKGSDDAKWEGILVVRPQDVDVRTISGARAPPAAHRQVIAHGDLTSSLAFRVHAYASVSFPSFSIMYVCWSRISKSPVRHKSCNMFSFRGFLSRSASRTGRPISRHRHPSNSTLSPPRLRDSR
jgi:hypothetical protein